MSVAFCTIYVIVIIAAPVVFFVLGYYLIKKAVKNGILEAYKEIHKDQQ